MVSLSHFQTHFGHLIETPDKMPNDDMFMDNTGIDLNKRLDVYRNNVFFALSEALGASYPVIKALVGEDYFTRLAVDYARTHPPVSPILSEFGESFSSYLSRHPVGSQLVYLPDVAALECCWQIAYHAADEECITPLCLQDKPPHQLNEMTLAFCANVSLLKSSYAIERIWSAHQVDTQEENIHIDQPQWLVVYRHNYEVNILSVDEGSYRFYQALKFGQSLAEAALIGSEYQDGWECSYALGFALQNGFFLTFE